MTLHTFWCELAAFAIYFVYTSYFEWVLHRHFFHTPKWIYPLFRKHTLVHHQIYGAEETYHTHDDHPPKVTMDWWGGFAIVGVNVPVFWAVQHFTHIPSMWGGILAISLYFLLYESLHWGMHVPRAAKFLSNFTVYRFLEHHHRVHHKHMLSNLNVIMPLADWTLGTLRDADGNRFKPFAFKSMRPAVTLPSATPSATSAPRVPAKTAPARMAKTGDS